MNTANFGKTSLFVEYDFEQQTSTHLWSFRVNKSFKSVFVGHIHFVKLPKFENLLKYFTVE